MHPALDVRRGHSRRKRGIGEGWQFRQIFEVVNYVDPVEEIEVVSEGTR